MASLGYAVPGAVMAVGVDPQRPRRQRAGRLDAATRLHRLLLTGSIAALVYAYLVRFLAVSSTPSRQASARSTPTWTPPPGCWAAGRWPPTAGCNLPLMRPSLLAAALLVFVDVVKELPATLMMRPFDFDTGRWQGLQLRLPTSASPRRRSPAHHRRHRLVPVILLSRTIARLP